MLTIAQLPQALRVLAAAEARVDPFDVSPPLLAKYLPQYAARAMAIPSPPSPPTAGGRGSSGPRAGSVPPATPAASATAAPQIRFSWST